MNPLYEDGTMKGSSGAAKGTLSKIISFNERGCVKDILAGFDGMQGDVVIYYTGSEENEITEDEYYRILNSYSKTVATEYRFNEENIKTIIK